MRSLSPRWRNFLLFSLAAGLCLRLLWATDMEYKEDEEYNFVQSQLVGHAHPWPWLGMPSGVYVPNPGMSVWVFAWLARLAHATDPVALAHALQLFSVLGIALVIPFALHFVSEREREPWLWAAALALVNPIAILYQRKLWPEPFLPFFSVLVLMGWWKRERFAWALVWGFVGAWLGQIHMSGFFLAAALALWTLLFGRRDSRVRWDAWLIGSFLGALPLIPWLLRAFSAPLGGSVSSGLGEAIQLKYWVFWASDPLGLHVGNALGLLRGNSNLAQLSDFARYPLIGGTPTYLVGLAHLILFAALVWVLVTGIASLIRGRARLGTLLIGDSRTALAQNAALIGCGALMTATTVMIRRYYLMVTFPLEFVWLARRLGHRWLIAIWCAELVVSAAFVGYVHVNNGSLQGDYGKAFHVIMKERESMGPVVGP